MKNRKLHTIAWVIFGAALLFNQVGLNFFHDKHDAHEYFAASQKDQTILLNHGEHCQACSLDVLFNIVLPVSTELPASNPLAEFADQLVPEKITLIAALSQGRAPPIEG